MRKIAKLSLVAAVAVAGFTTSASADSLAEAFAASKVKGELKSNFFQKKLENGANAKSSIWVNGGNLSLTTGSFNGLTAGVTFQTSHVTAIDDNLSRYNGDMDASGSVMSELYLAYTMGNTTAKVGRQYITTPLVAGSGSRMIKESFEGIVLVNTDIPNTTLVAAYVDKYQTRTDSAGEVGEFGQAFDGAYTVYVKNNSVANLTLQAQYAQVLEYTGTADAKLFYAEANYKLNPVTISAQTYQTDDGSVGNSDGKLYGIKVAGNMGAISAVAAYTTSDDEKAVLLGLGNGADYSFTSSPIRGGNYGADTDSYLIGLGYKFNMGLGLNASYTNWDDKSAGGLETSESNITATYAFNKALSTKVMYSAFENDGVNSDDYRSRVYLSYKF